MLIINREQCTPVSAFKRKLQWQWKKQISDSQYNLINRFIFSSTPSLSHTFVTNVIVNERVKWLLLIYPDMNINNIILFYNFESVWCCVGCIPITNTLKQWTLLLSSCLFLLFLQYFKTFSDIFRIYSSSVVLSVDIFRFYSSSVILSCANWRLTLPFQEGCLY